MINHYTMSERRQEKIKTKLGISGSNINSLTAFNQHVTLSNTASDETSLIVPTGPYTHIRIHPLLANANTAIVMRVTGWTQIEGTATWIPTLLFVGSIAGVQSSTAVTNNLVDLKFVYGITVSGTAPAVLGAQTLINNSAILSVASIVVPQYGCSYIECDFTTATTAQTGYANIYYSYCSI